MRREGMSLRQRSARALGVGAVVLALASCDKVTGPASGTFTNVYQSTLAPSCVECHKPTGAATVDNGVKLDFTTQTTAYTTLLANTVSGSTSKNACAGVKIIVPSDTTNSYFDGVLFTAYNVNNFGGVAGCTPYTVHLQDQNLSSDEQSSILTWIKNGAQNN